ncbi:MAG: hypothetical protein HRU75_03550 [Planctomycetia bacterium]|nr:MAG: hypothetical protein HRU75_03550 [Planctomycetia bacterium]
MVLRKLTASVLIAMCLPAGGAAVILQYFEARWETIERRMPDVFTSGYSALWLPPPGRADTGGFSVGYDVFDRFNLGTPLNPTLYGTEQSFRSMVEAAHTADVSVFVDLILNHNGFRDHTTPGFAASGGYPGFAVSLPEDSFGDFHPPGSSDVLSMRLAGLIDIAQEKNHVYVRQPATAGANNLPNAQVSNNNRRWYPDLNLPADSRGYHPFNLADPLAGDPIAENATGVLLRYTRWLLEVQKIDGFRIDAAKHMPTWYFDVFHDDVVYQRGRPALDGSPTTPFSFGEVFDGNMATVASYIRKDGFGNRDALDFPLYFAMHDQLNANGFGNWTTILNQTIDASDGSAFDGSRGVSFVSSHDNGPPADDNLAYTFILTKTGYPLVYHNAGEFGSRPFPQSGRGDALGGQFGEQIRRLVRLHNEYARDGWYIRSNDEDVIVYERDNVLLVGLSDNQSTAGTTYDQRVVATNFDPGTRLHELTGNADDPVVDPGNNISNVLVVDGNKFVTIRVPRNIARKGYVAYGPVKPGGALSLSPVSGSIPPDDTGVPAHRRRIAELPIVTADAFTIQLQTTDPDPLDPHDDDNAVFKLNAGGDFNGSGGIDILGGVAYGFEQFVTTRSPRHGGGSGLYQQVIDATLLPEGVNYLRVLAFRHRNNGGPIFNDFRLPFYVDREPPAVWMTAPTNSLNPDISQRFFRVRATRADRTTVRCHAIFDQPFTRTDAEIIAMCNAGNQMTRTDTDNFEFIWTLIDSGYHTAFIVAFEESGSAGVTRYNHILAMNGFGGGPGDVNNDGVVNNFDIDPFVQTLLSGEWNFRADVNGDGYVNNFDIDAFVAVLLGS